MRAERRLGEMMREQEKAKGTRNQLIGPGVIGGVPDIPPMDVPTLASQGIDKNLAPPKPAA